MKTLLAVVSLGIAAAQSAYTGDAVELHLRTAKKAYRVGEKITFELVFKNVSKHSVKLLPNPETYAPDTLEVSSKKNDGKVEEIEVAENSMDWEAWSKEVIVLAPNEVRIRKLEADFSQHLPADWKPYLLPEWRDEKTGMPYLLFIGGSALKLPHFGEYVVTARYKIEKTHPVAEYVRDEPKLWFGKLRSLPITIDLKE